MSRCASSCYYNKTATSIRIFHSARVITRELHFDHVVDKATVVLNLLAVANSLEATLLLFGCDLTIQY